MKFTIARDALQKELSLLQGIVERKATIPALSNILIETSGKKRLALTGTDLDVHLRCAVQATVTTEGALCLPAQKLFEIARLLPDGQVEFAREEKSDWVNIKCENTKFRIAGKPKDDFPDIPKFKKTKVMPSAEVLRTFIQRTIFAITQEESKYTLSGAKFIIKGGAATMVTTDGHRLSFIERAESVIDLKAEFDCLIPRKSLAEMVKLTAGYEGEVGFGADDNLLYFELGDRLLSSRRLTGQFPNWDLVMPKGNDKTATIDASVFNLAVKRAMLMSDEKSHAVKVQFEGDVMTVTARDAETGEAETSCPITFTNGSKIPDPITIGFNASYLQDFFNAGPGGDLQILLKDGNTQALFKLSAEEESGWRHVIMPLRID